MTPRDCRECPPPELSVEIRFRGQHGPPIFIPPGENGRSPRLNSVKHGRTTKTMAGQRLLSVYSGLQIKSEKSKKG